MVTGEEEKELERFKRKVTSILERAKYSVHKWEPDVEFL